MFQWGGDFDKRIIKIEGKQTVAIEEKLLNFLSKSLQKIGFNPYEELKLSKKSAEEQERFEKGNEEKVPRKILMLVSWLVENNIYANLYRKRATSGCREAIDERSEVLGVVKKFSLDQEIKTMVYDLTDKNGNITKLAVHTEGNRRVDEQAVFKKLNKAFKNKFVDIVKSPNLIPGRQNPINFLLDNPDGIQVFDKVMNEKKIRLTNAGRNTWGIEFLDFNKVISAIKKALKSKGTCFEFDDICKTEEQILEEREKALSERQSKVKVAKRANGYGGLGL